MSKLSLEKSEYNNDKLSKCDSSKDLIKNVTKAAHSAPSLIVSSSTISFADFSLKFILHFMLCASSNIHIVNLFLFCSHSNFFFFLMEKVQS